MVLARSLLVALSCFHLAVASAPSAWSNPSGSGSSPSAWSGPSGSGSSHGWSAVSQDFTSRYSGPVAIPVVLSDGTLANTPEVAAARSQHLAALNKAKALWYGNGGSGNSGHGGSSGGSWPSGTGSSSSAWPSSSSSAWPSSASSSAWPSSGGSAWTGPQAWPSVLPSGHLADTPSVAAARAAHLGALAQAHQEAEKWKPQGHGWN